MDQTTERPLSIEERLGNFVDAQDAPETPEQPEAAPPAESQPTQELLNPAPAPEEDDGVEVNTLEDLANAIGVDVNDLFGVKLPVNIDGKREEITLGQWKDSYTHAKQLETKAAELEKRRAEIDQLHKQKVETFEAKEQEAAELINYMEQQLFQQYAGVDWQGLRQSDPGQWAALSFQFEQQKTQLGQMRATAAMKWDNARRELSEAEQARDREIAAQEWQQMMDAIPEWKDPTKYEHEAVQIKSFLLSNGFTPKEVDGVRLRQVLLARDAMRYREMTKQAKEVTKNKVFKIGKKVLTSGTRASPNEQTSAREAGLKSALKKSGNYKDAAALISERLKG